MVNKVLGVHGHTHVYVFVRVICCAVYVLSLFYENLVIYMRSSTSNN